MEVTIVGGRGGGGLVDESRSLSWGNSIGCSFIRRDCVRCDDEIFSVSPFVMPSVPVEGRLFCWRVDALSRRVVLTSCHMSRPNMTTAAGKVMVHTSTCSPAALVARSTARVTTSKVVPNMAPARSTRAADGFSRPATWM